MYTYCANNPLVFFDPTGMYYENTATWGSVGSILAAGDTVLPVGDAIYVIGLAGCVVYDTAVLIGDKIPGIIEWARNIAASTKEKFEDGEGTNSNSSSKDGNNGDQEAESKSSREFKELIDDINNSPEDWEQTDVSTKDSTKKGNKGGKSIEEEFTNTKTGEKIYKHTLTDSNNKPIEEPHYRPYPKQINKGE